MSWDQGYTSATIVLRTDGRTELVKHKHAVQAQHADAQQKCHYNIPGSGSGSVSVLK